jgi:DNA/RNA endonuclease YhcR with UshA esterase domain
MKKIIFIAIVIFGYTSIFCQTKISVDSVSKYVGETVMVCTKIFGGKYLENAKDAPTFLNAGGNYPNAPLTIVIWAEARKSFKNKPEEYYTGKSVCVTGKVESFKGKPQIVITNESKIVEQIMDNADIKDPK